MTENNYSTLPNSADIGEYENVDLTLLNTPTTDIKPIDKKLESFLVKIVFIAKIVFWVGISLMLLTGLYGWTRNQTQNTWLMNLGLNTAGSPLCTWMNHGQDVGLKKDSEFRDYLVSQNEQVLTEYRENNRCMALDTIAHWLEFEKQFESNALAKTYETIIPKKFLLATLSSLPELSIIAEQSPEHRMHHEVVLQILSDTTQKLSDKTTHITCDEIQFHELTAQAQCQVSTASPLQSRTRAIDFLKELDNTGSLLVQYPNTLNMKLDEKTQLLTTDLTISMTYIPSRYESAEIQKLTYDKR